MMNISKCFLYLRLPINYQVVAVLLIFSPCTWCSQGVHAQNNQRTLEGEVSTSNYRAPFGDDLEVFNLGDQINSEFSEYNPVVSPDAKYMLFTTRNDSTVGQKVYDEDRQYFEDIQIAIEKNGRYVAGASIDHPIAAFTSKVNTQKHDAPVFIDQDAGNILLFKNNDLWSSVLENGVYSEPVRLPKNINFKYYHRHASLTADGKTMVFTAEVLDKKLNRFHLDIFMAKQSENGDWENPVRLPNFINSPYHEDSPEISPDGKLLFFSSDRKDGLGGYDIYYVELFKNDSILHRLAPPINSPADDIYFKMIQDSSIAFVSSNRLGGYGGMDIYKLIFNRFDPGACEEVAANQGELRINGADTIVSGSRLLQNSMGTQLVGKVPRTIHWYLNDSLVSIGTRLEMPILTPGKYELRLYASAIDNSKIAFISGCMQKTITVLEPSQLKADPKLSELSKLASVSLTEAEILRVLPAPLGDLALQNDVYTTYVNTPIKMEVLKNDGNDLDELKLIAVGNPLNGTSVIDNESKGTVIYYPSTDYIGNDAFSYRARSPFGSIGDAYVGIRVLDNGLFSADRVVKDDRLSTNVNTSVTINLFDNDIHEEGSMYRIAETTLPVNGSLKGIDLASGVVIYEPKRDFVGSDLFTYTVNVPDKGKQKAFVYVNVIGAKGELPVKTSPDYSATQEGKLLSINVLLNDKFNDADAAKVISLSKTANGASQIYDAEKGIIVFAPYSSFSGNEYFTYTVLTRDGSSYVESISVYVEPKPEEEHLLAVTLTDPDGKTITKTTEIQKSKEDEVYAITDADLDNVDVKNKPKLDLKPIYFDFDRAVVRNDAIAVLDANIAALKQSPNAVIQVVSHCDSRGSKAYNMVLSARRAKATVDYLVKAGISQDRIIAAVGVGEDNLINDCGDGVPCSKEDHQQNRRSEFVVVGSLKN